MLKAHCNLTPELDVDSWMYSIGDVHLFDSRLPIALDVRSAALSPSYKNRILKGRPRASSQETSKTLFPTDLFLSGAHLRCKLRSDSHKRYRCKT